jgi:flagella basal body P-ring formation protein FlgA
MVMRCNHLAASRVAVLAIGIGLTATAAEAGDTAKILFVPRTAFYPGDVITDDALVERKFLLPDQTYAPFGASKDDLVGKVARRTLIPLQPIPASALKGKDAVIQGQTYKIIYSSGSLTVTGVGVPLRSAAVGQDVNVRNPDSGNTIKATVQADGTLVVDAR